MSRAEEITSEVRRLVLTCKAMEAQLQQSVPKKTHQEVVAKMQATIDSLAAEVESVKQEFQKSVNLSESVALQKETIGALSTSIQQLDAKVAAGTVPFSLYQDTFKRVSELQEKIQGMVEKTEYAALQKKCDDLRETMVPKGDYLNLQAQFANYVPKDTFESLQVTLSQYVPREMLNAAEARARELESKLENYVPRSEYDELTARIELLAKEASETVASQAILPEPEIKEIQSQLSEIKGAVEASQAFVFANTPLSAKSAVEFLNDLEQAPLESIENHVKSGDFERWFKDVLQDSQTAESLKSIREANFTGDELRSKLVAVISPLCSS